MLGISFRALDVSRERRAAIAAVRAIRIEEATKDAQQHVQEDLDEWDMVDVEDPDAEASALVDLETGKSKNPVAGSTKVDEKRMVKEKVNEIKIEETEAERIALVAGDDIGDEKASHHIVMQKSVSHAADNPFGYNDQNGTTDRPISNRHSLNSSMKVGENNSRALSETSGGADAGLRTHENSPLGAEMLARLKFLDEEDSDEGGVKL